MATGSGVTVGRGFLLTFGMLESRESSDDGDCGEIYGGFAMIPFNDAPFWIMRGYISERP